MSNESTPGWWGRVGTIATTLSAVIGFLVLVLGGGFVYTKWFNIPDLAYTILPTYKLQDQSFSGLVVENRGRATAHEVSIRLTDLGSNIEQYSVESDEIWILKDGGTGASSLTLWLDRMAAGSSATIYLLTSAPGQLHNVVVTAEEGRGHLAAAGPRTDILLVTVMGASTLAVLLSTWLFSRYSRITRVETALEQVALDLRSISLPYDFIDHFAEAEQAGGPGSVIEPHLTPTCVQESKKGVFEHPPISVNEFSMLTYNLVVPRGTRPLKLEGFIGIETELHEANGLRRTQRRPDNAVLFEVLINGQPQFHKQKHTSEWEKFSIAIPRRKSLTICFSTNCLGDNTFNWAVWGEPLLIEVTE